MPRSKESLDERRRQQRQGEAAGQQQLRCRTGSSSFWSGVLWKEALLLAGLFPIVTNLTSLAFVFLLLYIVNLV